MHNFVHYNPTKILFGKGTTAAIGEESIIFGRKGLLVYGQKSAVESGLHQKIRQNLIDAGMDITEHGGVRPSPLLSHVRLGIERAKSNKVDVIIALGGGSVIDTAKAISAGMMVNHDVWKFFTCKRGIKKTVPVTTVLTNSGTGSEMNSGMVVTNDDTMEKFGFGHRLLYPQTSILDPELTYSVSNSYTAYGAIDTIAHLLEYYLNTSETHTPVQDNLLEALIESTMQACMQCLDEPCNYTLRSSLMWSSGLALHGIVSAGLGRVGFPMHLVEHSLSGVTSIPHGAGLAITVPGWMQWQARRNPEKLARLAQRLFAPDIQPHFSTTECAEICGHQFKHWFHAIGAPVTLAQVGVNMDTIPTLAQKSQNLAKIWRMREYSSQVVAEILHCCL